jgi:hypothetical protein
VARYRIVIAPREDGAWIVAAYVNGSAVPFVDECTTKRAAWVAAKAHADVAMPADVFDVELGERRAEGMTPDAFVSWLRTAWRG